MSEAMSNPIDIHRAEVRDALWSPPTGDVGRSISRTRAHALDVASDSTLGQERGSETTTANNERALRRATRHRRDRPEERDRATSLPFATCHVRRAPLLTMSMWGPWLLAIALAIALAFALDGPSSARPHGHYPTIDEPLATPAAHFLIGNEARHDLFAGALEGRGGAFLGVGGEQCYTLAALADAERVYLLDRDPWIVALHRELGRRIVEAPTPADLLEALDEPVDSPASELVDAWPAFSEHLRRVAARRVDGRATTWLGDRTLYDRIRGRWREGAVVPVAGDLTGNAAMASIARDAAARDLRFTTVYLSNAEESLPSLVVLAANLGALPRRSSAIVLRTFFREPLPAADGLWSYQIQALDDLLACVERAPSLSLHGLIDVTFAAGALLVDAGEPGLSMIVRGDRGAGDHTTLGWASPRRRDGEMTR